MSFLDSQTEFSLLHVSLSRPLKEEEVVKGTEVKEQLQRDIKKTALHSMISAAWCSSSLFNVSFTDIISKASLPLRSSWIQEPYTHLNIFEAYFSVSHENPTDSHNCIFPLLGYFFGSAIEKKYNCKSTGTKWRKFPFSLFILFWSQNWTARCDFWCCRQISNHLSLVILNWAERRGQEVMKKPDHAVTKLCSTFFLALWQVSYSNKNIKSRRGRKKRKHPWLDIMTPTSCVICPVLSSTRYTDYIMEKQPIK